jgi:hypothetical protein
MSITSVMKQTKHLIKFHRYEPVHGGDADLSPINGGLVALVDTPDRGEKP